MNYLKKLKTSLLVLAISTLAWTSNAGNPDGEYSLVSKTTKSGQTIIRVSNGTGYQLYCWIESESYFVDFYVDPYSDSRWYVEPYEAYVWGCE